MRGNEIHRIQQKHRYARCRWKSEELQHEPKGNRRTTEKLCGEATHAVSRWEKARAKQNGGRGMLLILSVISFVAWLLGIAGAFTIGAFVHLLLITAIALFVAALLDHAIARS